MLHLLLACLFFTPHVTHAKNPQQLSCIEPGTPIASKKELGDTATTRDILVNTYDFKPVQFKAEDGVELKGLLYTRPNAKRNIVLCAGFFPGLKEGMAGFLHLFPKDCNFLLFDARGHGQSTGRFWTYLGNYGLQEYKDIIGATTFLNNTVCTHSQAKKNFVFAYCIGGLHAAHAHIQLSKRKELANHSAGFIADSAPATLNDLKPLLATHILNLTIPKALGYRPSEINKTWWYYWVKLGIGAPLCALQALFVNGGLDNNSSQTTTQNTITSVTCPMLFIHGEKDNYIPSTGTQDLAKKTNSPLWLLPDETNHFTHYFDPQWKDGYMQRIAQFIKKAESKK